MRQAGEPAVEDILESIKKVIVRDAQSPLAADRLAAVPSAHEPEDDPESSDEEILDLATEFAPLDEAPLMKSATVGSMRDSLAALQQATAPAAAPSTVPARTGETTIEGLVRDMLRPALAEWLDKNLPPLVERMVQAEIARIVGKQG